MRRKIAATVAGVIPVTRCSGAGYQQETGQSALDTLLDTGAETAAQQLVSSNTAKPMRFADHVDTASEVRR